MYTGLDVLVIVVFTMFVTVIVTLVLFSCIIANGIEEREIRAYWRGFSDGEKVGRYV